MNRATKLLSSNTNTEFYRYAIVGGVAFVVDFLILYILSEQLGMNYLAANAVAFLAGLSLNYILSIKWVFSNRKLANIKKEFYIFAAIGLVGLAINEVCLWVFTDIFLLYLMYSKIVATGIVFFWNFIVRKILLF